MPKPRYCYWSVATGAEADDLEACVRSAREAGVHRDFHVLTDRVIEGAECYDAYECDRAHGLYKLHYLKAGMTRLNVDWFVWVDPRTRFLRNPVDVLSVVGASPIHVPLEAEIGVLPGEAVWRGMPAHRLAELMIRHGVYNPPRLSGSECWSVHHDVIELVHNLAMGFGTRPRKRVGSATWPGRWVSRRSCCAPMPNGIDWKRRPGGGHRSPNGLRRPRGCTGIGTTGSHSP